MVDTTILVSGNIWYRWPYEVLLHATAGDIQLVLSPVIIAEARRKFTEKFPSDLPRYEAFLEDCDYELVPNPTREDIEANWDLMRDPNDIPIALSAINAQVDYFISEDKDFTAPGETTKKLHEQLLPKISGTFLREVMNWTSDELEAIRGRTREDMERD